MVLLREVPEAMGEVRPSVPSPMTSTKQSLRRQGTPVGAPNEAHVHKVLATLRERLQAQLEAGDEYESAETRAIFADARYRLSQVNDALVRIDDGKYGECDGCGTQISADRLVIQPFATRCLNCQERHDRKERRGLGQR